MYEVISQYLIDLAIQIYFICSKEICKIIKEN